MDIVGYLDSKNIDYKISGSEAILTCPGCGKQKLYLNIETGVFHCFRCEAEEPDSEYAKGHISKLQKLWGDALDIKPATSYYKPSTPKEYKNVSTLVEEYHNNIKNNVQALKYLFSRGISEESINRFKLGFVRKFGQNWIAIPSYEDGVPKLLKYRKMPPYENENLDKYIREPDCKSVLFNGDIIDKYNEIIICEGQIDCISLIQNGYENAVGITGGAGTLLPEWFDKLYIKDKIYLCLDPDPVGQKAARDVWAARLGTSRCWNVVLPDGCDLNEFFLKYDSAEFEELLKKATRFKVEGVSSFSEVLHSIYKSSKDGDLVELYPLPWNNINKLIGGGLAKKRLTTLGGLPAVGKTSWALNVCYHLSKNFGIPTFYFCLEMPEESLAIKILQIHYGLTYREIYPDDVLTYSLDVGDLPIYFGYSPNIKPETFYNTMREVRNRYGVELGVFDNLQLLVRSDKESDIGNASKMFKNLSMDLNIMFILISQPRKLNAEEIPTYDVLKGSSAISADADQIILLHRRRIPISDVRASEFSLDPKTYVIVDKSRFSSGGKTLLHFDGNRSTFMEPEGYEGKKMD